MTGCRATRSGRVFLAAGVNLLLALGVSAGAFAGAAADSSLVFDWGALYRSRLSIERSSNAFPWNDEAAISHLNDRLAVLGRLAYRERLGFFLKGACGFRLDGPYQTDGFLLEQGHVSFRMAGGGISVDGRLFLRERVYGTDHRLTETLSDEAPLVRGRGEGLSVDMRAGSHFAVRYIESMMRSGSAGEIVKSAGFPRFDGGGDVVRVLRVAGGARPGWRAGLTLSQVRSLDYGDAVTAGVDAGFRLLGVDLAAELARSQAGSWDDLRGNSLFGLRPGDAKIDRPSSLFSENTMFAAEAGGIALRTDRFGSAGLVPGYRFSGAAFANPQGEIAPGISETYAVAWWKPSKSDATLAIEAADGWRAGEDRSALVAKLRTRFRGGFEFGEGIVCREGERSAAFVSLLDENARSRVLMTVRIDELGDGNDVSCYTEGRINLGSRLAAKGALYLCRSRSSAYSAGFEYRPRERYLLSCVVGSFMPAYEEMMLGWGLEPRAVWKQRYVQVAARIWFGGV